MPELPEVECLSRAIKSVLEGKRIQDVKFYRKDLRGEIPIQKFRSLLVGQAVTKVHRRSKYMLWDTAQGIGIIHLGMTGNVIYRQTPTPELAHTHAVFTVGDKAGDPSGYLHYVDPRRFGWISCCTHDEFPDHDFFKKLGPEPLSQIDLVDYLWVKSRKKTVAIKNFLMNAHVVVGVGNIYANEALFRAGVRPSRPAGKVSRKEMDRIVPSIRETLREAIKAGGTSFRDFKNADGEPGYFAIKLQVYGRGGQECRSCGNLIKTSRLGNRATYFCTHCQK
ncbi:bifunctional DNA-formamidopyrimidine glycosylase/DNA-(apurinic or apyrimidinic site) lyase [Pseudobacteriovorax antillogorgiicola]|uniref:Formamidopyrimidine-DNA glycosylase n=1 Tax=Pseudobacteriovorax antillogorgiicola TaxID=1513793 RepID=A0A1Y6CXS9_9BACT|nr:bifunctional DNA-formamidopyrimidine glycosylase/DNA-(apurinic or apyrimidinic site) lyase [Pseudobacteriovorax antillogorgiicola]TCS41176.1 DNA-(apurinic or apyrimidinic site) lyase [Pseudobacteriovorax antillogorgiicola]SMF83903.1 DNA-(apurinic or apyrimidinic site) lyase [Pseudobacteriovorax antillogorgiicola]